MNEQFQNKLSQYEAQPPASAWEDIEAALDSGVVNEFSKKLYRYEQQPSVNVWQRIIAILDQHHSKLVPIKTYSRSFRYGSAIAALFIIGIIGTLLLSKKTVSDGVVKNNILHPGKNEKQTVQPASPIQKEYTQISIARLKTTKKPGHIKLASAKSSFWLGPEPTMTSIARLDRVIPGIAERRTAIDYNTPVDKYMIYSDDNGNPIRLSKKLFDSFACSTDKANCKQKIKKLQEQVASSAISSDFTGILDMLNKLEENQ